MRDDDRIKQGKAVCIAGIICNVILASFKLFAGIISGMISIVADAVNNYSDATASVVSLVGFKLSEMPADDEHPFGHARYEYISGLVVAFLVMIAGVELLKSSITRVFHPEDIEFSVLMFVILIISVVVKASMAGFYLISGRKIGSPTILAAAADSRNDVISTSSVLIASFISYHFGVNLDGYMGMFVAAFILVSGIDIVKDTIKPLLGTTPSEELVNEMEQKILSYEGVLGTHDLMVHDYGPGHCFASVHVEVPAERNVLECHELIDKIEQDFEEEKGIHLVIHYDPIVTSDEEVGSIRSYLKKEATKIDSSLSIHDLRIVPGEKNTNVIFDCVIPMSLKKEENRICEELKSKLTEKYPDHTAVIKIDHSFVAVNK